MGRSTKGETFAFCKVCNVDFSVAGGGVHQVKRHCRNKKHTNKMKDLRAQPKIDITYDATIWIREEFSGSNHFC